MGLPALKEERRYTYGDYRYWPEEERWELIDGVAWNMSAAANRFHQELSTEFLYQIRRFLEGKPCKVYHGAFDVLLPDYDEQEEDDVPTVVQPDILVVCDEKKLTVKGCTGAPDFLIEILSPSTSKKDFNEKLKLYERHGVREYWIADPGNRFVQVYLLDEKRVYPMAPVLYGDADVIPCAVLAGLEIDLADVFGRLG